MAFLRVRLVLPCKSCRLILRVTIIITKLTHLQTHIVNLYLVWNLIRLLH